jgi:phage terminase large subunit-like protein
MAFSPTPHPILITPTTDDIKRLVEKVGEERTLEILNLREDKIQAEKSDPYRHGFDLPHWTDADEILKANNEILVLGGNRASKTEWAAKRIVQTLCNTENARVWCLHTTNQSSIQMQQPIIHKYLPSEFKELRKNKIQNVSYTQKNGFSDNTFILPNKSQCIFMNYAQKRDVIEGGEVDLIWCDELVPLDWIETLRYRIVTRSGKLIVTFTPITGYSSVVKEYVSGAKIIEHKPSPLLADNINVMGCPRGTMPYKAKSYVRPAGVMWFHSELNPYNPFEQLKKTLLGKKPYEVKIRAYGWADNISGSQFPRFNPEINIVKADDVPRDGTNYMVVDPAGARNWFMLWIRASADGCLYVYREFPDSSEGEWALPSADPDGKMGTAQRNGAGRSLAEYKNLISSLEGEEAISERYIDPRAGGSKAVTEDGGVTLIDMLDDGEHPMNFQPAAGIRIEQGVSMINDGFAYDYSQEVSPLNKPKLYISEECQNLIYCLKEWTGLDGEKGATKDPIDCLRYLITMNPEFLSSESLKGTGGGSY